MLAVISWKKFNFQGVLANRILSTVTCRSFYPLPFNTFPCFPVFSYWFPRWISAYLEEYLALVPVSLTGSSRSKRNWKRRQAVVGVRFRKINKVRRKQRWSSWRRRMRKFLECFNGRSFCCRKNHWKGERLKPCWFYKRDDLKIFPIFSLKISSKLHTIILLPRSLLPYYRFGQSINYKSTLPQPGVGVYGSNSPWLSCGEFEAYTPSPRFRRGGFTL